MVHKIPSTFNGKNNKRILKGIHNYLYFALVPIISINNAKYISFYEL
jgi:hypothetical protein